MLINLVNQKQYQIILENQEEFTSLINNKKLIIKK